MERIGILIGTILAIVTTVIKVWRRFRQGDEMHFVFFADANRHLDVPPVKKKN
jgi:hypothetical protein